MYIVHTRREHILHTCFCLPPLPCVQFYPHEGGPAYPPGGADDDTTPRIQAQTVLPHDGGPVYPPDGADRHQGPRLQAQTVLPHVGGEDWASPRQYGCFCLEQHVPVLLVFRHLGRTGDSLRMLTLLDGVVVHCQ